MRIIIKYYFLAVLFFSSHGVWAAVKQPTFEFKNKEESSFFIRVNIDDRSFVQYNGSSVFEVKPNSTLALALENDRSTRLYIYTKKPTLGLSQPFRAYEFTPGLTIYVTWNNGTLYPQTGPLKGITKKTDSGLSLAKNVKMDPKNKKNQNIFDVTKTFEIEQRLLELAIEQGKNQKDAPTKLNDLWKTWCDPTLEKAPTHPDSLFCASGFANPTALIILRMRFTIPQTASCGGVGDFSPGSHALKLVGNSIPDAAPQAAGEEDKVVLSPRALYNGFFLKIDNNQLVEWRDFNMFVKPVKTNPALANFINDIMGQYGLSSAKDFKNDSDARSASSKTNDSVRAYLKLSPEQKFPLASIEGNEGKLNLDALFGLKCKGEGTWKGSLFCGMGEGNPSALYFGQVSFVKPKKNDMHAISLMMSAIRNGLKPSCDASYWERLKAKITATAVETVLNRQLSQAIAQIESGKELSWEDLRDIFVVAGQDLTEWIPGSANGSLKPYGIEIAP